MDAVTVRWIVIGEVAVAILAAALVLRPDVWVYWRQITIAGIAAFILVPVAIGLYLVHADRKLQAAGSASRPERT